MAFGGNRIETAAIRLGEAMMATRNMRDSISNGAGRHRRSHLGKHGVGHIGVVFGKSEIGLAPAELGQPAMWAVSGFGDETGAIEACRKGDPARCLGRRLQGEAPTHAIADHGPRPSFAYPERSEHDRQVGTKFGMAVGAGKGAEAFALGVALLTKRGAAEAAILLERDALMRNRRRR